MIALLAFALAASDPPPPPSPPGRGSERLAADPALAARVRSLQERSQSLHWMVGGFDIETRTEGARYPIRGFGYVQYGLGGSWLQLRESYDGLPEQLTFIGYDPAGRRWRSTTIDRNNDVITLHAPGWINGRAVFEGEVRILGATVHLRRTVTRLPSRGTGPDDEDFTIVEEQRVGGRWRTVTTQHFGGRPVN
jgi:hypothetical protein